MLAIIGLAIHPTEFQTQNDVKQPKVVRNANLLNYRQNNPRQIVIFRLNPNQTASYLADIKIR